MTNPVPRGPGFDFAVYSSMLVGFTVPNDYPLPFIMNCYFVWSLPFDVSGMGVQTSRRCSSTPVKSVCAHLQHRRVGPCHG
jgi:hypothetical protein